MRTDNEGNLVISDADVAHVFVEGHDSDVAHAQSEVAAAIDARPALKIGLIAALVAVALVSIFLVGAHFSQPEAYKDTIASLDTKQDVVSGLMGVSLATSAAITALPGDVGTPIAEKLANLGEDFLIVLTAIYLEKMLLTAFGFAAFRILIPVACVAAIVAIAFINRPGTSRFAARMAAKVALFAVMIAVVVPASIFISDKMEEVHNISLENTLSSIQEESGNLTQQAESVTESQAQPQQKEEEGNWFQNLISGFSNGVSGFAEGVAYTLQGGTEKAIGLVNQLAESFALLVVTSCIIPILVLLLFLWLMKLILGINVSGAVRFFKPRSLKALGK